MTFNESLAFYLVIGLAVAAAYALVERSPQPRSWLAMFPACVFWPLYLPLVLTGSRPAAPAKTSAPPPRDDLTAAIEQVERELDAALEGLDGWAESVLLQKTDRLRELRGALVAQAERIRDMETLLAKEQAARPDQKPAPADERWERSWQARHENMARLAQLCVRTRGDLLATLAWIRELVSMIHLAKFTGAPAARAEELVAQIAAAVESISSLAVPEPVREVANSASLSGAPS